MSNSKNSKSGLPLTDQGGADLGDLMGLDPAPGEPSPAVATSVESLQQDVAPRSAVATPSVTEIASKPGGPALWMETPQDYPGILEGFRAFKTRLLRFRDQEDKRVFLLTGAENKVGVSTVVFNLGLVMGWDMADERVLVVDTNFFHPSLNKAFHVPSSPGLIDFLLGDADVPDVIYPSKLANLDLAPIGESMRRVPSPFFLSKFGEFIKLAKKSYDFVLFDSSPGLRSSEARGISIKMDGVIIVAEANRTRWQVVSELKKQLESEGAEVIGSFLNKRQFFIPRWLYQYV